ncbi:hypothetical protein SAMN05216357_101215 [Porphyromonadaceae bacterium KH3CP3RA]|nr:hypothetical protein SAMN05216357_101215 [Porphyromonadaceae bacterium KH3CP3RA]
MSKKRNEYIDQLLSDLKLLEQRLLSVKESDTLPFSFFSASFDRIEKISRSLHELELMQIGEMKEQMERLVRFLSESDGRGNAIKEADPGVQQTTPDYADRPEYSEQPDYEDQPEDSEQSKDSESSEYPSQGMDEIVIEQERVSFTERIILPEYRDPRISEGVPSPEGIGKILPEKNGEGKQVARSLNDIIQVPPALLDLRRGISLNDRFLFQRELFNNNRSEMNRVMETLNRLGSFEEAETYLKREQSWNFENQTVKEFLLIIKKGFE